MSRESPLSIDRLEAGLGKTLELELKFEIISQVGLHEPRVPLGGWDKAVDRLLTSGLQAFCMLARILAAPLARTRI